MQEYKGSFKFMMQYMTYGAWVIAPLLIILGGETGLWIVTFCALFTITMYVLLSLILGTSKIQLDENTLTFIPGRGKKQSIPYSDIQSVEWMEHSNKGHKLPFLEIKGNSSSFKFSVRMFEKHITKIVEAIAQKAPAAQWDERSQQLKDTKNLRQFLKQHAR